MRITRGVSMYERQHLILTGLAALIIGFAIGAIWQYTSARSYSDRLDHTEHDLTFKRLEAMLGAATIESQRGSYEIARQLASDFFTGLQEELPRATAARQQEFREILRQRDSMITALSRSDPQTGAQLAQLFTRYRIAMGEPVGPDGSRSAPPPPAVPADTGA
jgi:hypothetical protein